MGELMGFRRKHRAARDFGVFLPCLGSCTPSTQIDDVVSLGSFCGTDHAPTITPTSNTLSTFLTSKHRISMEIARVSAPRKRSEQPSCKSGEIPAPATRVARNGVSEGTLLGRCQETGWNFIQLHPVLRNGGKNWVA
jgi:hypothetical protein